MIAEKNVSYEEKVLAIIIYLLNAYKEIDNAMTTILLTLI